VPAGTAFRLFAEAAGAFGAAGSIQPGIALTNASPTAVTVAFEVSNLDGSSSGLFGTLTLPPNGHLATPLKQIQGLESLPSSFKGVVRLSSDAAISVMGIRIRYNERGEFLIAMTPPAVENAAPSGERLFFPYILDAVAGTTQIILFSGQTGLSSSGTLGFSSQSGELSNVLLK
jgi:hypothetical protein